MICRHMLKRLNCLHHQFELIEEKLVVIKLLRVDIVDVETEGFHMDAEARNDFFCKNIKEDPILNVIRLSTKLILSVIEVISKQYLYLQFPFVSL